MKSQLVMSSLLILLLLVGCGQPQPQPPAAGTLPWPIYIEEIGQFEDYYGVEVDFRYTTGVVEDDGHCALERPVSDISNMALSTATTGMWQRVDVCTDLQAECYFANGGVWVLPEYAGERVFVAWEPYRGSE